MTSDLRKKSSNGPRKQDRDPPASAVWEWENGESRTLSCSALGREADKFASVHKSMAVARRDRVTIRIPEAVIAMLARTEIGAVRSVVYGGLSIAVLRGRVEDGGLRMVIAADGGYRNGKLVEPMKIVDEARTRTGAPETVMVVERTVKDADMDAGATCDATSSRPCRSIGTTSAATRS